MRTHTTSRTTTALTLSAAALLLLAGCSTATAPPAAPDASSQTATMAEQAAGVAMTDAWIKASESGMTGAFGVLSNSGTEDVTLSSVTSAAADSVELHETLASESGEMLMSKKEGGFTIPAGGTLLLEPGANHIMLMGLLTPVTAGAEVEFTLVFADGSTLDFTAPAKDYSGANENYSGDEHAGTDAGHRDAHTESAP
ncbi:copper chaperone PCu(A)C [Microterricola viridarii]|uniref:Copper chaperone PCu(A)C n=1 Tax=Microterricola viridarii TaxID=412690 RepID=A0A0Y0NFF6_9MICO|nr:copper chaperone PCu(A)C [Microterricola viridarii]AMB60016.1 hypothetical protein AWU67_15405 [Microterricola viridarii]